MVLNREQKQQVLQDLTERVSRAKTAIFTDYRGLKVKDMQDLRSKLRSREIDLKVAKNNLLRLALGENKITIGEEIYKKPLATVFSYQDEVEPCKILHEFSKENPSLEIVGGLMEKKFISAEQIKQLASLPGREELYAKVVGSCAAPISGFVNVLAGNLRNLVSVLRQYQNKIS